MAAVGELVLVLGLLVSAHCEVRARDPEVEEEEEEELGGRAEMGGSQPGVTETPPLGEGGNYRAQSGNWCAFVHRRVVTMAVACGTEKYTIKSQSPCPSGKPDCHLVMYKLSTRPVYTQKQKIHGYAVGTAVQGIVRVGDSCEDTNDDPQRGSGGSSPNGASEATPQLRPTGLHAQPPQQRPDPNREQNDHQDSVGVGHEVTNQPDQHYTTNPAKHPGHTHIPHHPTTHNKQEKHHLPVVDEVDAAILPAALPVPHMMALVMSQLQPILEGFNRSLEHLSRQVGVLAHDVAQLKNNQLEAEPQMRPPEGPELDKAAEERLDTKLDEVFQHIREVRQQMQSQRTDLENRLHSQHAMLHYNLTHFKTDIDMKLKRHQKMLQVSLQAMNATLAELKLDQDQPLEDQLEDQPPSSLPQTPDDSAVWEAIERLDNMVVNNTVKVDGLMEDMEMTSGSIMMLKQDLKVLGGRISQTGRNSQIQFMETGLEVEAAKVAVLTRVGELAGNLSLQGQRLSEMDVDVDYLYTVFYKHNSSADCDCKGLKATMAQLERGVANVTELANENRLALEEDSGGRAGQWDGASDWEPAVEALRQIQQMMKESLASEQSRIRTLDQNLNQLNSSVSVAMAEVSDLKEADRKVRKEMMHLSSSFSSLLKDTIRHSDVLDLLLGEEVLEFLDWSPTDQEAYSIPALQEQLRQLKEQLMGRSLSLISEQGRRPGDREEVPSADQPSSSWLPGIMSRSGSGTPTREHQVLLHPDGRRLQQGGDGSDLWNLEKTVEDLKLKVLQLEEKPCNDCSAGQLAGEEGALQAEVMWLKRGLEEHLRTFKNVFSNADVLARSDATLELDKVLQLVKKKDKKRGGGGERREASGRGGHQRNKREAEGPIIIPDISLLFVGRTPRSIPTGEVMFHASLNNQLFYSDMGTFSVPVDGIYLFVLTLDLGQGNTHLSLQGSSGGAARTLFHQQVAEAGPVTQTTLLPLLRGEELRLERRGGAWVESPNNVIVAVLVRQDT
ncbi:LOW QUALITY PROTEIN: multimerin-2-like [Aulostomus maculatus]